MSRVAESLAPDLFALAALPPMAGPTDYPVGVPVEMCDLFEKLALDVRRMGFAHYSARDLTARIRWHHQIDKGDRDFKVNNNWSPALARWFIARHPTMADFFELRKSPGEEH